MHVLLTVYMYNRMGGHHHHMTVDRVAGWGQVAGV